MNHVFELAFFSSIDNQIWTINDLLQNDFDKEFYDVIKLIIENPDENLPSHFLFFVESIEKGILSSWFDEIGLVDLMIKIISENHESILKYALEILYLFIHSEPDLIQKLSNDIFRRSIVQILSSQCDYVVIYSSIILLNEILKEANLEIDQYVQLNLIQIILSIFISIDKINSLTIFPISCCQDIQHEILLLFGYFADQTFSFLFDSIVSVLLIPINHHYPSELILISLSILYFFLFQGSNIDFFPLLIPILKYEEISLIQKDLILIEKCINIDPQLAIKEELVQNLSLLLSRDRIPELFDVFSIISTFPDIHSYLIENMVFSKISPLFAQTIYSSKVNIILSFNNFICTASNETILTLIQQSDVLKLVEHIFEFESIYLSSSINSLLKIRGLLPLLSHMKHSPFYIFLIEILNKCLSDESFKLCKNSLLN
jgi:hypothetical protein